MRILFVSDEDRCRGPMARGIAEQQARKHDLVDIVFDSAGLHAAGGESPFVEVITFLRREKISILKHRSKHLNAALADNADVIFCMTQELTRETKEMLGQYYAPKVVLLMEGVDLDTKRRDVEMPSLASMRTIRPLYAQLLAALGRMTRTLEEPSVCPEYLGAKSVPKRLKPGSRGAGGRARASTIDPQTRRYLVNVIFDFVERSFEPPTSGGVLEMVQSLGQEVSALEVEELLRQDLHGYLRLDREGTWHVVPGASEKRREKAKAKAKARAQSEEKSGPAPPPKEEPMTKDLAFGLLSLKPGSSLDEAQKKYRALMQRYHPDKFHDDPDFREMADQKTKRLNEAWALVREELTEKA